MHLDNQAFRLERKELAEEVGYAEKKLDGRASSQVLKVRHMPMPRQSPGLELHPVNACHAWLVLAWG